MADTKIDYSVYAEPWQKFLEEYGEQINLRGNLDEIRKQWDALFAKLASMYEFPPPDTSVTTENHTVGNFWVRSYLPPDSTGEEPVGVYFHGGGWAMGSVDQEDAICRILSKQSKVRLVSVEYRLAPANKYPIPLNDCVEAAKWALQHFKQPKVFLSGGSAGGNLAFTAALKLIDEGLGDKISGVVALVPITVLPQDVPEELKPQFTSYREHAEHTANTDSAMYTFIDLYGAPKGEVYASPLLHPRLKDLPKVYLVECGTDTLRDDARLMKTALEKAGVDLRYQAYPGFPHYSWTLPSKHLAGHSADFYGALTAAVNWINEGSGGKA